ncbi:hypothetical protein HMPREF9093_02298 [Fusobacterium sp. oral taxon 370 str. F0437]|uniref:hypothetical protein n=1 Tax=Fusobacterium sp. oral taxon 370 TaxID=712288 RepID=UPI000234A927|nr:hypothetical protein [Fusobacterium sp. oral taxon 370]EHI75650.1 hypothetical protein HMPREF9093_02298 [Fusobacterium sp. oral taxon 370 str. F0437]
MYVAVTGKGKAKVIQFCEQHRIPKTNKKKTVVIKTIGNYEILLKENPNIIEELKDEAKRLTIEKKEKLPKTNLFRFGHSLVNALWKELSLDDILGEDLSGTLFALVVYRLGSSYSTFLENRKTPFISLNSLSHSEFYDVLLQLDKKTKDLIKCFNKFFDKKIKRDKNIVYYHRGSYNYNSYWNVLYGINSNNFQKGKKDLPFNMNLFFDSYGIPISYQLSLKEENSKNKLEDFKKNFKNSKLILVLTKENEIQEKNSISSVSFEDLSEDIQNEILKDNKWKILERDVKTNEILEKEKILDIKDFKLYVYWNKKRAYKDYLENNLKNGYICLKTDEKLEDYEISNIIQHSWNIEDKFKITDVKFSKKHIQGHFTLCFICLCIIRYFQYLLGDNGKVFIPMIYANKAISNPMIFMKKVGNDSSLYPIHLTNSYIKLAKILGLNGLNEEMNFEKFQASIKMKLEK